MIRMESHNINHENDHHKCDVDDDESNEIEGQNNEDENVTGELFVQLTEMVRSHYCDYLKKQLWENMQVWRRSNVSDTMAVVDGLHYPPKETEALQKCCHLLEDRALRECIHARRYQRSMLKIISEVRRSTRECRLEGQLKKLIISEEDLSKAVDSISYDQKGTQTDESVFNVEDIPISLSPEHLNDCNEVCNSMDALDSPCSMSLQQKMERFQERLNQDTAARVAATHKGCTTIALHHTSHQISKDALRRRHKRSRLDSGSRIARHAERYSKEHKARSSLPTTMTPQTTEVPANAEPMKASSVDIEKPPCIVSTIYVTETHLSSNNDVLEQDDEIAKELAQLFSEEKTELEELLGLDPNSEMDDPQVRSILEEIENASLSHEIKQPAFAEPPIVVNRKQTEFQQAQKPTSPIVGGNTSQIFASPVINSEYNESLLAQRLQQHHSAPGHSKRPMSNLRHSLWPCELYMQRRRLNASLSRLIEEDFRWHELIKWKFTTLFGEDSDDEFATCSPSIELDDALICSCIRRISPWMVKHLMKPMRDGLIANRFLFKKLAKRLAHSIVLENQYPDERLIKRAVEEFFCIHQAVVSLEDMADMPNLTACNDID